MKVWHELSCLIAWRLNCFLLFRVRLPTGPRLAKLASSRKEGRHVVKWFLIWGAAIMATNAVMDYRDGEYGFAALALSAAMSSCLALVMELRKSDG
jgi:hypothetical protein